ncbi:MAG TPA: helix-turn-helix domain-containing protein [Chitinophagales bacterium]|nr:helix-turn-helix domain-containing protein [Chitinophagales bacterium]
MSKKNLELSNYEFDTMEMVSKTVFAYFDKPYSEQLRKVKNRSKDIVIPRQICCWFFKKLMPSVQFVKIANWFDNDHATSLHSIKCVNNMLSYDAKTKEIVSELKELITPQHVEIIVRKNLDYKPVSTSNNDITHPHFDKVVFEDMKVFWNNIYNTQQIMKQVAKKTWDDLHNNHPDTRTNFEAYYQTIFK